MGGVSTALSWVIGLVQRALATEMKAANERLQHAATTVRERECARVCVYDIGYRLRRSLSLRQAC